MTHKPPRSHVAPLRAATAEAAAPPSQFLTTDGGLTFRVHAVKRGGMGLVYICSPADDAPEGRPRFALKTFNDSFFFDPLMQAAVETEARTWLSVSSAAHVLPLLGIVKCQKKPHLVMPAMAPTDHGDVSLADEIRRHPHGLPAERCLFVVTRLAIAMAECSRLVPELVHGDIKPENILLASDGSPLLADFGAARLTSGATTVAQGTALYLAPECWADPRLQRQPADVYAFGVTLFEMLCGMVPHLPVDDDASELERMHREVPARFASDAAADSLESALQALALECLQKDPGVRPPTGAAVLGRLLEIGSAHEPISTLQNMGWLAAHRQTPEHSRTVEMRVETLLQEGDGAAALRILDALPREQVEGTFLKLYGTAYSLANRDVEALPFFDRFLASDPDVEDRFGCLNEKGLSLKRLNRFDEARRLYEDAIPSAPRSAQLMLRTNYAATLLEQGEARRAVGILQELSSHHPQSPEVWGLLANALLKAGNAPKAIDAMQSAVRMAPRNGQYRIMLARLLMDGSRDISAALEALDSAYGLGFHTREWFVRTLACNLLLGRQSQVQELLSLLGEGQSEPEAMEALNSALEMIRKIEANTDEAVREPAANDKPGLPEDPSTNQSAPQDAPQSPDQLEMPSASGDEDSVRARVRAGEQAHFQVRFSMMDSSLLCDVYYGIDQPDYAKVFADGLAQFRTHTMGTVGTMRQRAKPYAFARCPNCGVMMLTQRDEGERYLCQGCNERVSVALVHSPRLDRLLREATAAAGEQPLLSEAGTRFVAIAPRNDIQARAIKAKFTEAGYRWVAPLHSLVYSTFRKEAYDRGIDFPEAMEVWMCEGTTAQPTAAKDATPEDLDRLLRELRREVGQTWSISTTVDPDAARLLMSTDEEVFEKTTRLVEERPDDLALLRGAVEMAAKMGRLEDTKPLLARARLVFPDDPDCLAAAATVALAEGRHEAAIPVLETLLQARPMDQRARAQLAQAYRAAGDDGRAMALVAQLRSHGFLRIPREDAAGEQGDAQTD